MSKCTKMNVTINNNEQLMQSNEWWQLVCKWNQNHDTLNVMFQNVAHKNQVANLGRGGTKTLSQVERHEP